MKIYGHQISPPARMVRRVAAYLCVEHEYVIVDILKSEHRQPEYKEKNPNLKIPILEDGDFTLYESIAIIRYLADTFDKSETLLPKDPKQRALVNMHLAVLNDVRYSGQ